MIEKETSHEIQMGFMPFSDIDNFLVDNVMYGGGPVCCAIKRYCGGTCNTVSSITGPDRLNWVYVVFETHYTHIWESSSADCDGDDTGYTFVVDRNIKILTLDYDEANFYFKHLAGLIGGHS